MSNNYIIDFDGTIFDTLDLINTSREIFLNRYGILNFDTKLRFHSELDFILSVADNLPLNKKILLQELEDIMIDNIKLVKDIGFNLLCEELCITPYNSIIVTKAPKRYILKVISHYKLGFKQVFATFTDKINIFAQIIKKYNSQRNIFIGDNLSDLYLHDVKVSNILVKADLQQSESGNIIHLTKPYNADSIALIKSSILSS